MTQSRRFLFSTKLRKWGGVNSHVCLCSCKYEYFPLQGCVSLFFFPQTRSVFCPEAMLTRTGVVTFFLEVAVVHPRAAAVVMYIAKHFGQAYTCLKAAHFPCCFPTDVKFRCDISELEHFDVLLHCVWLCLAGLSFSRNQAYLCWTRWYNPLAYTLRTVSADNDSISLFSVRGRWVGKCFTGVVGRTSSSCGVSFVRPTTHLEGSATTCGTPGVPLSTIIVFYPSGGIKTPQPTSTGLTIAF